MCDGRPTVPQWPHRAGTVAGCWLREQGLDGEDAIRVVRAFRSPRAIETAQQEDAVRGCDPGKAAG